MIRTLAIVFAFMMICLQGVAKMPDTWLLTSNAKVIDERIDRMLGRISKHEHSDDRDRLLAIFKKTQKEFLHRYKAMADLDELAGGEFNCLTATSLFAEILSRAGFSFRIIETNYHIFLLVSTSSGDVLLETTDRYAGFITSQVDIRQRIAAYRAQDAPAVAQGETAFKYDFEVCNDIDVNELSGLLYFNQAVKAYNTGEWQVCSEKILLADCYSDSPRIAALASILLCTITVKELSETEKQSIRRALSGFGEKEHELASR